MDVSYKLQLAIQIAREDVDFGVSMGYLTEDEGNAEFDKYVDELTTYDVEHLYDLLGLTKKRNRGMHAID